MQLFLLTQQATDEKYGLNQGTVNESNMENIIAYWKVCMHVCNVLYMCLRNILINTFPQKCG